MNNRLVLVLKKILVNKEEVTQINRSWREDVDADEFYFVYRDVIFSVMQRSEAGSFGAYSFYMYPTASEIETLMNAYGYGENPDDIFVLHSTEPRQRRRV
jgi:hypothetical protein